jgi:predicted dehydrogenase
VSGEIRWGILGTGFAAQRFVEGLRYLNNTRVISVASRSAVRAAEFARHYSIEKSYGRYDELTSAGDIDVVYVASMNSLHRDHCLMAIEAGNAVLCEKPFALNSADARGIVAAARRRNVFCMEAMRTRFLPVVHELRKLVGAGAIGEPRALYASIGHNSAFDPAGRLFSPDLGGGALLDLGCYPLSLTVALFGRPDAVKSESVIGASKVDEEFAAILSYSGGRMANVFATLRADILSSIVATGSAGAIELSGPIYSSERLSVIMAPSVQDSAASRNRAAFARSGILTRLRSVPVVRSNISRLKSLVEPLRKSKAAALVRPYGGNGFTDEASEVIRCISTGLTESALAPLDDTVAVMEIIDSIRESSSASNRAPR